MISNNLYTQVSIEVSKDGENGYFVSCNLTRPTQSIVFIKRKQHGQA